MEEEELVHSDGGAGMRSGFGRARIWVGVCPLRGRRPQQRMAGAVVARADDLSAIFYNPAGLVQLPGLRIMGGFSSFLPRAEIVTHLGPIATTTPLQGGVEFAPHFFTSIRLQIGCGWGWD